MYFVFFVCQDNFDFMHNFTVLNVPRCPEQQFIDQVLLAFANQREAVGSGTFNTPVWFHSLEEP